MKRLGIIIAAMLAWLSCGAAMLAQSSSSETHLEKLEHELLRLRQENRVAEVEQARLRQIITRLEAELATVQDELTRRSAMEAEPPAAAEVESPAVAEGGSPTLTENRDSIEEEELTDEELGDPVEPEKPSAVQTTQNEVDAAARNLYDDNYTLFHEKRYGEAEEGFGRFLALHPATELSDNAQFWIGEARFARGRYEEALQAFLLTVERFPDGNKVPDAFYKAGRCLELRGDRNRAIATYEETVRRFPSSAAAISAREHLEALR